MTSLRGHEISVRKEKAMIARRHRNEGGPWWILLIRALLMLMLGVFAVSLPGVTANILIMLFGIFISLNGVLSLFSAVMASTGRIQWAFFLEALIALSIGLFAIFSPAVSVVIFIYLIATWSIINGIFDVAISLIFRRQDGEHEPFSFLSIFSLLFGIVLFAFPGIGVLAIAWVIGIFAFLRGISFAFIGWKLRQEEKKRMHNAHRRHQRVA